MNIQSLSDIFQDFYEKAAATVSIHLSLLYGSNTLGRGGSRDRQLKSLSEIAETKRKRQKQELHQSKLQDAIEKRVTEAVFQKIWRHHSSEDTERDDALESKIKALAIIGVGVEELGLESGLADIDMGPIHKGFDILTGSPVPPINSMASLTGVAIY